MKLIILLLFLIALLTGCEQDDVNWYEDQIEKHKNEIKELKSKLEQSDKEISIYKEKTDSLRKETHFEIHFDHLKDTIKKHTGINDTIKLLGYRRYGSDSRFQHVYAFIDFNLNSKFHKAINKHYGFNDDREREQYITAYKNGYSNSKTETNLDASLLSEIKGNWKIIYNYQGKFYNYYSHCNYLNKGFTVSDSTLIHYNMEGLFPSVIHSIKKNIDKVEINTHRGTYHLKLIDPQKHIYIFEKSGRRSYVIHQSKINTLPIIVEDCHETGGNLIDFEEVKVIY